MLKKILLGLLAFVMVLAIGAFVYYRLAIYQPIPISDKDRAAVNLMPLPSKLKLKNGSVNISMGLKIDYSGLKNTMTEKSLDRFFMRLSNGGYEITTNEQGLLLSINCHADSPNEIQQVYEDESYSLRIKNNGIFLEAPGPYGIIRGLETLYQLIEGDGKSVILPIIEIQDKPRFPWRGLMIDVSRHWVPKEVILRTLDAMALVKMNVFHWHLSDDQGFRVESKVFPKLHKVGSNGKYYTQQDIKEVIQYAKERGIRIVPEFDLPGHSKSWQIAYPELGFVDFNLEFGMMKGMAFAPPIDPTKEDVYNFLDKFIEEMSNLFPDPFIHIGGDEVNPKYWNENIQIQNFMKENGMKNHGDLQAYFNKRMNQILKKYGKRMMGWNEILHPDLGTDIVVQSWTSHRSLFEAVQHGGTAILSSGIYLDHVLHAKDYYKVDPLVLLGAVDIEPDTTYWKMYDMTMDFAGNEMESELVIFDRDPDNVFGYFAMMENRMPFKNGVLKDNKLVCAMNGPVGEMEFEAEFLNDSLKGKISLGLLSFKSSGMLIGGSMIPGTVMPKVEVMKPLTQEEESRIIGGEACQWSEFVDGGNIESRLWPTAAAIAEKLWSPQVLTQDADDMYRRLAVVSSLLNSQGSTHRTQYIEKLSLLVPPEGFNAFKNLVDVLEEVKYHGRMPGLFELETLYLPDFALDRIVDAARPESMEARAFNRLANEYTENPGNAEVEKQINIQLQNWKENDAVLRPFINENEKLADIENISRELAMVSEAALVIIAGDIPKLSKESLIEKLNFLETGEHGLIVAVVPGLRTIILAE